MNIDTNVTHITKSGSNIFLELGFDEEEALLFNTQSQKNINDAQVLKEQLMSELAEWNKIKTFSGALQSGKE